MYDSGWSGLQLNGIKSLALATRAEEVLAFIERRVKGVPASNRLWRAIQLTRRTDNERKGGKRFADYAPGELEKLAEAWRTMWDAIVVGHAISQQRPSGRAINNELLQAFLSGADLPAEDSEPRPRNLQFEAYTGAYLIQSGASVTRAEPDFRFQFYAESVGVAVKRLTSIKSSKVYDRLREGSHQLQANQCRGFVALSIDNWVTDLGTDRDPSEVGRLFNEQVRDAHAHLDTIAATKAVLGVFLTVSSWRWEFRDNEPYIQWSVPQQVVCFTDDEYSEAQFGAFFDPARARWEASLSQLADLVT